MGVKLMTKIVHIHEAHISRIKKQIRNGTYEIDSIAVAQATLRWLENEMESLKSLKNLYDLEQSKLPGFRKGTGIGQRFTQAIDILDPSFWNKMSKWDFGVIAGNSTQGRDIKGSFNTIVLEKGKKTIRISTPRNGKDSSLPWKAVLSNAKNGIEKETKELPFRKLLKQLKKML